MSDARPGDPVYVQRVQSIVQEGFVALTRVLSVWPQDRATAQRVALSWAMDRAGGRLDGQPTCRAATRL